MSVEPPCGGRRTREQLAGVGAAIRVPARSSITCTAFWHGRATRWEQRLTHLMCRWCRPGALVCTTETAVVAAANRARPSSVLPRDQLIPVDGMSDRPAVPMMNLLGFAAARAPDPSHAIKPSGLRRSNSSRYCCRSSTMRMRCNCDGESCSSEKLTRHAWHRAASLSEESSSLAGLDGWSMLRLTGFTRGGESGRCAKADGPGR